MKKEEFIEKAKKIHGDKYDYSLVDYKNNHTKINIICNECKQTFLQKPNNHLNGNRCPFCSTHKEKREKNKLKFLSTSKQIHGEKYDYSLVEYRDLFTKIKIICPVHGLFEQIPNNHKKGYGCPKCSSSKGEKEIENFLKEKNIRYETQKKFAECKNKRELPFDFYLPDYNSVIEYQGIQHYECCDFFGGFQSFCYRQLNDEIKRKFCEKNNIQLIEISYKDNIRPILKNALKF